MENHREETESATAEMPAATAETVMQEEPVTTEEPAAGAESEAEAPVAETEVSAAEAEPETEVTTEEPAAVAEPEAEVPVAETEVSVAETETEVTMEEPAAERQPAVETQPAVENQSPYVYRQLTEQPGTSGAGKPYTYGQDTDTGRTPYSDRPVAASEREGMISSLAMIAGIAAIFSLFVPYIAIPVSVMAILFGIVGYRQTVIYRRRAICGIVTGVIALLFGSVLLFCVFALRPYNEDLYQIFREYFSSLQ